MANSRFTGTPGSSIRPLRPEQCPGEVLTDWKENVCALCHSCHAQP
jgi:hypothetical protein